MDKKPVSIFCQYKLVLMGEWNVGKSCLAARFVKGQFHEWQDNTIGAAFLSKTLNLDSIVVKLEIWDTAGQERYRGLAQMYYRNAHAVIVAYDLTIRDTYLKAKNVVKELKRQARPNLTICLVGNKCDLSFQRLVDYEEAKLYAEENGLLFKETSAKNGDNVNDVFIDIAKKLSKEKQCDWSTTIDSIKLEKENENTDKRKLKCCGVN